MWSDGPSGWRDRLPSVGQRHVRERVLEDFSDRVVLRRGQIRARGQAHDLVREAGRARHSGLTEPRGRLDDRLEHRLEVGRRRRDDPQDFGGRGLLLQRLGDLAVTLLKLGVTLLQRLEQPGVLDGDDGLVRERLQECDLTLRERADFECVATFNTPIGSPVAQERD